MSKIAITGSTSKSKEVLEEQVIALVRTRLAKIKEELIELQNDISNFEKSHNLRSEEFQGQFMEGELSDLEDYFVWDGMLKLAEDLTLEQENLRELL